MMKTKVADAGMGDSFRGTDIDGGHGRRRR